MIHIVHSITVNTACPMDIVWNMQMTPVDYLDYMRVELAMVTVIRMTIQVASQDSYVDTIIFWTFILF